ncbi:dynamin family protein [Acinetobacter sp. ANC 5584]
MFNIQKDIQESIVELENFHRKYALSTEQLEQLKPQINHFRLRVPLIGAFSAGKSSLINRLIDQKLLCVEIDPASNLATEISYSEVESIKGFKTNQFIKNLTAEELKQQQFSELMPDGHIEVQLNQPFLATLPHLCLADLPGLDSKSDAHMQAIYHYLGRSLAYVVAVSSDEGTLKDSIKNFLQELALHKAPVLVIITKSDKKTPDELEGVKQQISDQVRSLLPADNYLDVVCVSARKRDVMQAVEAFQNLEHLSETRFKETVVPQYAHIINDIIAHLTILMNKDDLNSDKLEEQKQQLISEAESFDKKLSIEHQTMKDQLPNVLHKIMEHIHNRLLGESDHYANALIAQSNIESDIGYSVRIALTEGIEKYFKPLVDKYIRQVEADIPSLIINQNFHFGERLDDSKIFDFGLNGIVGVLGFILKRFPLAAVILPVITSIFKEFMSDRGRELQLEIQKEAARTHVRSRIIPQVLEQIRLGLASLFKEQLDEINQKVQQQINEKVKQTQYSITMLEEQLQKNAQERLEQQEIYQQDLNRLEELKQKLIA